MNRVRVISLILMMVFTGCASSVNTVNATMKPEIKSRNAKSVADITFKVPAGKVKDFYFRFAPHDSIILNAWVVKGNDISLLSVKPYGGNKIIQFQKVPYILNRVFTSDTGGIYVFTFKNTNTFKSKIYRFTLHRIPSSRKYMYFNTSVFWDTIYDTTYRWVTESTLVRYESVPERVFFRVISLSIGEKRCMKITLPENAEYTYYMVGISDRELEEQGGKSGILFDMARGKNRIPHIKTSKGASIDYAIDPSRYRALGYIEGRAEHPLKGARKIVMDLGRIDLRKCHVCIKNNAKTDENVFLDMVSLLKVPVFTYERVRKPFVKMYRVPK